MGFERMQKVLEWCLDLGVETLTVYAFSIDNFKRPQIEVDTLMGLVRTRFRQLLQDECDHCPSSIGSCGLTCVVPCCNGGRCA